MVIWYVNELIGHITFQPLNSEEKIKAKYEIIVPTVKGSNTDEKQAKKKQGQPSLEYILGELVRTYV